MRLMLIALALFCCTCDLPTEADVREATEGAAKEATELCRSVVRSEIPAVVSQVTSAAILACASLTSTLGDAVDTIEARIKERSDLIVYEVLVNMGCNHNVGGLEWDCSSSQLVCPTMK